MIRCMSLDGKNTNTGGMMELRFDRVFSFFSLENYCILVEILENGKTWQAVLRSVCRRKRGWWLTYLKNGSTWQAVRRTVRERKRGGFGD